MADVHILIVEDERGISEPLQSHLAREGFISAVAPTLEEARVAFFADPPDLVLLDVMLPDGDGRDLCREFRGSSDIPIVMLTARGEDVDKIIGLELGADDYVVKPFSAGSSSPGSGRSFVVAGRRTREPRSRSARSGSRRTPGAVTRSGEPVTLAAREFDLLACLMRNAGRVLVASGSWTRYWTPTGSDPTKTLDVHIAWLRKKLEDDPSHPRYITTIRGWGSGSRRPTMSRTRIEPVRSLRRRSAPTLVAAFGYVSLTIIVALTIPLAISLDRRARAELERENLIRAGTIAQDVGAENLAPAVRRTLRELVDQAAPQVDGRVIVVDATGHLIADSQAWRTASSMRPRTARDRGRAAGSAPPRWSGYSRDLGADIMATAVPIVDESQTGANAVAGAVRITRSMDQVDATVHRVTLGVVAIGAAGMAAGLILAFALSGSLARPLRRLADVAKRFGSGDLSVRAGDIGVRTRSSSSPPRSIAWPSRSRAPCGPSVSSLATPRISSERRSPG